MRQKIKAGQVVYYITPARQIYKTKVISCAKSMYTVTTEYGEIIKKKNNIFSSRNDAEIELLKKKKKI